MAKKDRRKNPNKSWRKFENETWLKYFDRILTYNRLQVIISFLTLLLAALTFYFTFIYKSERTLIRESIERNISIIESKIDRNLLMDKKDTIEYNKLIAKFQMDILDYITQWKAVSDSKISEDYAEMPLQEVKKILENEYERRIDLGNYAQRLFVDVKSIRSYEYLTDTTCYTKISEEKQTSIINLVKKQNKLDSISAEKIKDYLIQINDKYHRNLNYRKDLRKCISEMKDMTNNLYWYYYHDAIMDFVVESNNLFEISRRKYQNIPPYKYLDDEFLKYYPNDSGKKEILREFLIKTLNNQDSN